MSGWMFSDECYQVAGTLIGTWLGRRWPLRKLDEMSRYA